MDNKWLFDEHINSVIAKASKNLGFIKRLTKDFVILDPITYLFKTLVLPTLMYSSIIWAPFKQNRFDELNSVIRKFLRYASYKDNKPMPYWDHDYSLISKKCNLNRIESLHEYKDICFVSDYIRGNIKSETLDRNLIERNLTYNLRHPRQFMESTHRNNFVFFAPIYRMVRGWNTLPEDVRAHLMNGGAKEKLKSEVLRFF